MSDLRDKRVDLILQQLEELPTLPAVAVRVLQVTADDSASSTDVVRLIGSDPALTARILQLTRRADRGVRDDVRSIDRAVVLLGFEAVRNAVLAVSVFQALGTPGKSTSASASASTAPTSSVVSGSTAMGGAGMVPDGSSHTSTRKFSREEFWKHC